ncbi:glycosyltransferase family 2 protein [Dyella nitratireducens]|uniref:Glycosyl transferase n=1 Tax=Dyella nitratireducens TaxID=1849580 RepID=A0ABQ1GBB2_9GAMM|nr:glycosyltransferase family 2 protein [Dyella nitratireducens]GGA40436.1 glycosyl transferase [Dyella nitratireducens]GLQ40564.1 glycosyl transferase [Dyella nitratireducens]
MSSDLVSVIMPVYNADAWLQRAIDSVLAQRHAHLELIAVDDGSSDRSPYMLDTYAAADARVHVLRQPSNGGVAAARNAGIAAARGDYVSFLDADDWWHPAKLERQLASMRKSGALISYASYWRVAEDSRVLNQVTPPPQVNWQDMLASNFIGNLTGMYARRLGDVPFQRIGHEDYVFWLEQVRRAGQAMRVESPEPLAWYLVRERSLSANKLRAASWQWEIYRSVAKLGMMQSAFCMARYVQHAVIKRRNVRI